MDNDNKLPFVKDKCITCMSLEKKDNTILDYIFKLYVIIPMSVIYFSYDKVIPISRTFKFIQQ